MATKETKDKERYERKAPEPSKAAMSNVSGEYKLISRFPYGYRNREDKTSLPPGTLIEGSQNVLTNTSGRIGARKGFTLDGQANTSIAPITAAFDWDMHIGESRHLRAGFNTSGSNGKHQFRYVATAGQSWSGTTFTEGQIYWIDLTTGLSLTDFNYATYWDATALQSLLLFVNTSSNIFEWSGAVTTFAAASNASGVISTVASAPTAGGTGYTVGDVLTITGGGGTGATVQVVTATVGAVTGVSLITPGTGYASGTGNATTGGTGTGATINITAVVTGYIQKQGTTTWAQEGFYNSGTRSVTINGTVYTYTGGESTLYLTGIAPDPTSAGYAAGNVIFQTVKTTPNAQLTSLPSTLENKLIASLDNRIYVSGDNNNSVYVSKTNNYTDFSFTSPIHAVGDGALLTLDGVPTALVPQQTQMYISAGKDYWYTTEFSLSADLADESLTINRLKTTTLQAAQSQALTTKIKNFIAFYSFEPIINSLGLVPDVFTYPQTVDLSYPIVNDINSYDPTGGSLFYHKQYLYVSLPAENIVRIYNMTDPENTYWEAPQILPVGFFSVIDGELYGHSSRVSETYKLFTGSSDNGYSMEAVAKFSFNNYGNRAWTKSMNEHFQDGYISSNTVLTLGFEYNIDGCASMTSFPLRGDLAAPRVCSFTSQSSLGKTSLGKNPLGGDLLVDSNPLPPYFHIIQTFPKVPFFFESTSFSSTGIDQQWEIISFGGNVTLTTEGNNYLKQ